MNPFPLPSIDLDQIPVWIDASWEVEIGFRDAIAPVNAHQSLAMHVVTERGAEETGSGWQELDLGNTENLATGRDEDEVIAASCRKLVDLARSHRQAELSRFILLVALCDEPRPIGH